MPVSAAIRQAVLLQPPRGLTQLTLSAGVCTDAERIAGRTGDGLPLGSGLGVFPAVTQLLANSNGDANVTGLTDHSSTTTAVANAAAKFNGRAFNVVSGNATANEGPSEAITGGAAATQYTVQGWAWLVSGAATVRAVLSDSVSGKQGSAGVVLTATPQFITVTATTGAASNTIAAYMETTVQQAGTWQFGGWQVTASPLAYPYAANGGTRVAGRVQLLVAGLFTATQGWIMCPVVPAWNGATPPTNPRLWSWGDTTTRIIRGDYISGAYDLFNEGASSGATVGIATVPVNGARNFYAAKWSASDLGVSIDNSVFTTAGSRAEIPVIADTTIDLLADAVTASRQFNGRAPWVLLGKGVLPSADVALGFGWGATVPTLAQIAQLSPGSKPTCLVPCQSADALLLPAYFDGT